MIIYVLTIKRSGSTAHKTIIQYNDDETVIIPLFHCEISGILHKKLSKRFIKRIHELISTISPWGSYKPKPNEEVINKYSIELRN